MRDNPVHSFDYVTLQREGKSPIVFPKSRESFHFACTRGFDFNKFSRRTSSTLLVEWNDICSRVHVSLSHDQMRFDSHFPVTQHCNSFTLLINKLAIETLLKCIKLKFFSSEENSLFSLFPNKFQNNAIKLRIYNDQIYTTAFT